MHQVLGGRQSVFLHRALGTLPCPEPAPLRARNPVQLPPVTWWQEAEKGRDHRSVCTFSPTRPLTAGSYRGEKKSISRWGRSKNQQRHPAHQYQRGTKGKARKRWSAQATGRTRAPGTRPQDAGPLLQELERGWPCGPCPVLDPFPLGPWHVIAPSLEHRGHTTS